MEGIKTVARDVAEGAFAIVHSGLALTGLVVVAAIAIVAMRPDLLKLGEDYLYGVLSASQPKIENTSERATAVNPADLTKAQAAVASWLARKYRLAPEPIAALVLEAHHLSKSSRLPPNLILAVVAIESNFHPYIQSEAGAQGLMQVMKGIHRKRYEEYGGNLAAFDPATNMRVGVSILQDFIKQQGGSVDAGLRAYLGGLALDDDGGYVAKVRAEEARLDRIAAGQPVPLQP